jgi:hypothetical protein
MSIGASSLILCERIIVDRLEGRTYLFRVITEFRASGQPTSPIGFSLFSLLTGKAGEEGKVRLRCASSDSAHTDSVEEFGTITIGDDGKRQLHLRCEDVVFPRFGNYEFRLEIEDTIVGRLTVRVGPRH